MSKEHDRQVNNEAHLSRVGNKIATVLDLKKNKYDRYNTTWGGKTDLGLYRTVNRILQEDRGD